MSDDEESTSAIAQTVSYGAQTVAPFLGLICRPAAEEFGLFLQDKIRGWRLRNAISILSSAQVVYENARKGEQAHPRLVSAVLEHGSWSDDATLQKMWSGLLVSSCSPDGRDESNLIFTTLLSQMTGLEVRVLNYACEKAEKTMSPAGLITSGQLLIVDLQTIQAISGVQDIHRLDRELDHLRSLELIHRGFDSGAAMADITPGALAFNLYARCHGHSGSPLEFFRVAPHGKSG